MSPLFYGKLRTFTRLKKLVSLQPFFQYCTICLFYIDTYSLLRVVEPTELSLYFFENRQDTNMTNQVELHQLRVFCLYTFFRTQCDSVLKSIYPSLTVITSNPFVEIVFLIFVIGINLLAKFTVVIVDIVLITGFTKKSVFTRFYSRTNLFMNLFRTTKPIKTFPR